MLDSDSLLASLDSSLGVTGGIGAKAWILCSGTASTDPTSPSPASARLSTSTGEADVLILEKTSRSFCTSFESLADSSDSCTVARFICFAVRSFLREGPPAFDRPTPLNGASRSPCLRSSPTSPRRWSLLSSPSASSLPATDRDSNQGTRAARVDLPGRLDADTRTLSDSTFAAPIDPHRLAGTCR